MKLCFSIKLCNGFICICLLYLVKSVNINHVKLYVDLYDKKTPSEISPEILTSVFNDFVFVFKHVVDFPHLFMFTRNDHSK